MTRLRMALLSLGVAVTQAGCSEALPYGSGEGEPLFVDEGVFVEGPPPEGEGGPGVRATYLLSRLFLQGTQDTSFSGVLDADGTAVAIRLAAPSAPVASGYWLVEAGPPLPDAPDFPSFDVRLSFGPQLLPGPYALSVIALDGNGRGGLPAVVEFALSERPRPEGELVFSLDWDIDVDLDVHVTTPGGAEIYPGNVREEGARLDFDSNKDCRIDGRRNENVVFEGAPPPGRYVVRVETFSLCGHSHTRWRVTAMHRGALVGATTGTSLPGDTRFAWDRGAGVTALELVVE